MDVFKDYLLSVTAAAVLCGIIKEWVGKTSSASGLIKILSGIFMACTLIAPLHIMDFSELAYSGQSFAAEAEAAASIGKEMAFSEIHTVIKSKSETYILDKAAEMGVDVNVVVTVEDLAPSAVLIQGAVSPYAKSNLSEWIVEQLGIPKEEQTWTGQP